tara:strand:- start:609 stop:914 length:306 start_codon:yes stop_codon:yes gene_type:complete
MAKKSKIAREKYLDKQIQKYSEKRKDLKLTIKNISTSDLDRELAVAELDKLPKRSSKIRSRNRCFITGRPRGIINRFKLSRLCFREMALNGEIPGVTKASW